MKKYFLLIQLTVFALASQAQSETNLGHLRNVYQSSYVDPANYTDHRLSIGLPGISSVYLGFANTGFAVKNFLDDENRIDGDKLLKSLRNKNYLFVGADIDLLHIEAKIKNYHWSFYSRERLDLRFGYPEDLFELPLRGNGAFVGSEIDFGGLALDAIHYNEIGIGWTMSGFKTIHGPVIWGGKIKLLTGRANIRTTETDATIAISEDIYEHSVSGDLNILTSGVPYDVSTGETNFDPMSYFLGFQNLGLGLDLGAAIQLDEDLKIWGSMTDLGYIRWKANPQGLSANANLYVGGWDIAADLLGDSSSLSTDLLVDSLQNSFDLDTVQDQKYTTMTTTRFNIGADYKITDKIEATATFNCFPYRGLRCAFALGLYYEPWRFLNISLVNTIQYKTLINPGLGLVIKPGPAQIYLVSDNILWAAFNPYASRAVNLRFGINLVFGKDEPQIPPVKCPNHHSRHRKQGKAKSLSHRFTVRKLVKKRR